jgi:TPR repeat protein
LEYAYAYMPCGEVLEVPDWTTITEEALDGYAPAQYLVAAAFEEQGNLAGAQEWYQRSAAQGCSAAAAKITQLKAVAASPSSGVDTAAPAPIVPPLAVALS